MNRRDFLHASGAALAVGALQFCTMKSAMSSDKHPNILWITCEDISPHLGCYGHEEARTPNLDRLASEGMRFENAFGISGVCAPNRSCIITGMYPTTLGTSHMRTRIKPPDHVRCFPEYLRRAGYYCSNRAKQDYQFEAPEDSWDDSSGDAHWRGRAEGQPFFSVFNFGMTHEGGIANRYKERKKELEPDAHDANKMKVPPYYPNTPEIREMWAGYFDVITEMDVVVGNVLEALKADGLAENTIVFYYSDHGVGLPRGKRSVYDSGMRVPMIVRWPGHIKPGTVTDDLISFVDLAPTVLSLAGVSIPDHMRGRPFLGDKKAKPRKYVYAAYDRIDERYDIVRATRDKRYKYIRNYEPYRPYALHVGYREGKPLMKKLRRLDKVGELKGPEKLWMRKTKPIEELYDLKSDPHEIRNLADSAKYRKVLKRMRKAHEKWMLESRDVGLVVESELWDWLTNTREDAAFEHLREVKLLGEGGAKAAPILIAALDDPETSVRYWAAVGLGQIGIENPETHKALERALADPAGIVRVGAAQALFLLGRQSDALPTLIDAMASHNGYTLLYAVQLLDEMGEAAQPVLAALKAAREGKQRLPEEKHEMLWFGRGRNYFYTIADKIIGTLEPTA
ncbi:sulfatase-like hydrolase/transferase [Candidatus Hydrogenedentota bacterium]